MNRNACIASPQCAMSNIVIVALYVGFPKLVRADKGVENAKVSFLQPFLRHQSTNGCDSGKNCFHYGKSVNNQVDN